jgi:flagellar basal-body rod modification protein FlgD
MSSVSGPSAADALSGLDAASTGGKTLGKQDFLKLLVTQISNQDPLNPMDNTEFVAQLAQFSDLEQSITANDHLTNLENAQTSLNNAQVANLVGKTITANGGSVALGGGQPVNLAYKNDDAAADVTVTVKDAAGNTVRTMDIGAQPAGSHTAIWDGKNDGGTTQPDGTYTITVSAKDASGKAVDTSTQVTGVVTSVTFASGSARLVIGDTGQVVAPADVITIGDTPTTTTTN